VTKNHFAIALTALPLSLSAPLHAKPPKEAPQPSLLVTTPLTPEDRQHLLNDTFTVVKTVNELPASVHDLLFQHVTSSLDGMADPGEEWQEGDVVGPKLLPFRRLVLAANSAQYSLVYSEQGGFAYQQRIFLYRLAGGHARLILQAWIAPSARLLDFNQLRSFIRDGKYRTLEQP